MFGENIERVKNQGKSSIKVSYFSAPKLLQRFS